MLGTEGNGAAEVGGCIDAGKIAVEDNVGLWAGELEDDPREFAVVDKKIRAAAKEFVGDGTRIEQAEKVRDRFMLADPEEIGGAADAERGKRGQGDGRLELD